MGQITSDGGSETGLQSDDLGQKQKTNFFNVPGMLVGLSPKSTSECDSVRSPTSPLDFNLFSNLSSAFRFQKPLSEGHHRKWDCNKVGLSSIMDSLNDDESRDFPVKPISLSDSNTILIGSQVRRKTPNYSPTRADFFEAPKSLPKNYPVFPDAKLRPSNLQKGSSDVLFEIGGDGLETDPSDKIQSFSLDSKRLGSEMYRLGTRKVDLKTRHSRLEKESVLGGSDYDLVGFTSADEIARPLSPEEIEQSEDYTCVISHGPVPKTTHIFGDYVLECHPNSESSKATMLCSKNCGQASYPTDDFLSFCYYCNKKLETGKDIYMYKGEKAFCSWDCRLEEISVEEGDEILMSNDTKSEDSDDIF